MNNSCVFCRQIFGIAGTPVALLGSGKKCEFVSWLTSSWLFQHYAHTNQRGKEPWDALYSLNGLSQQALESASFRWVEGKDSRSIVHASEHGDIWVQWIEVAFVGKETLPDFNRNAPQLRFFDGWTDLKFHTLNQGFFCKQAIGPMWQIPVCYVSLDLVWFWIWTQLMDQ